MRFVVDYEYISAGKRLENTILQTLLKGDPLLEPLNLISTNATPNNIYHHIYYNKWQKQMMNVLAIAMIQNVVIITLVEIFTVIKTVAIITMNGKKTNQKQKNVIVDIVIKNVTIIKTNQNQNQIQNQKNKQKLNQ
jgi:hypothetical protein